MSIQESFSDDFRSKKIFNLTSEKNVVEVANRRKVKKIKGLFSIFGLLPLLLIILYVFSTKLPKYLLGLWC